MIYKVKSTAPPPLTSGLTATVPGGPASGQPVPLQLGRAVVNGLASPGRPLTPRRSCGLSSPFPRAIKLIVMALDPGGRDYGSYDARYLGRTCSRATRNGLLLRHPIVPYWADDLLLRLNSWRVTSISSTLQPRTIMTLFLELQ